MMPLPLLTMMILMYIVITMMILVMMTNLTIQIMTQKMKPSLNQSLQICLWCLANSTDLGNLLSWMSTWKGKCPPICHFVYYLTPGVFLTNQTICQNYYNKLVQTSV